MVVVCGTLHVIHDRGVNANIPGLLRENGVLALPMDCYPILDEEDYGRRESEATVENIVDAAWRVKDEYELSDDWQYEVYGWLSENDCGEVENTDDQGGYPSDEALRKAFEALGFQQTELAV